jgi:signal transduction histidine kinase
MGQLPSGRIRAFRLPAAFAAVCVLGIVIYVGWSPALSSAVAYDAIAVLSAVAIVTGVLVHRPAKRAPWLLIAAGIASFAAGEITWDVYSFALEQDPFPSAADGFYLAGYPLLAAGVWGLGRVRGAGRAHSRASAIDSAIITVSASIAIWVFLVDPSAGDATWPLLDRVLSAAYPLMDILLLTLLVRLLFAPGSATVAIYFLAAGISMNIAGDLGYLGVQVAGSDWDTTPLGILWLLAYTAVGCAALHPSMAANVVPTSTAAPALTRRRLAALAAASAAAPAVLALDALSGGVQNVPAIVVGAALLALLVLARLAGLVRELERSVEEREALHESERAALHEAESAQRLLVEQNDRLRELDRLKDEFVALVSHELRTPLTSITGYLELVLDDADLSEDHRRFLEVVDRNADRLLRLVSDLLLVAQIESGKLALETEDVDLTDLATQSVEVLRPAADARTIDLRLEADPVPTMTGDPARLGQLLDNLISNAVKFTEDGGRVVVALGVTGDDLVLAVSDNGIGIPVAEQRRLFDRFFRATTAQDRAIEGTGLGLTIVHAIVRAHGGAIEVTSEEGQGTTFRVRLPIAGPATEQVGSPDRSAETVV